MGASNRTSRLPSSSREQRLYRLHRLRENEIDLQTELNDLADEIAWRRTRLTVVLVLLRATRRELTRLVEDV